MSRVVLALVALALFPATALAGPGDPDRSFGQRGTVTLKATDADAVGSAVKALSDGSVLAGGAAGGKLAVIKLRRTGSLDSRFGTRGQVVPQLPGTSLDGVKALATFRDGRIIAAGTLDIPGTGSQIVVLRLLPGGDVDPSFGAGLGYVLIGTPGAILGSMTMDRAGDIILGASRPGDGGAEVPVVIRLLGDGSVDASFASGGTLDGGALGLVGRVTGVLARPDSSLAFCVGSGEKVGSAIYTTVRTLPNGALDPAFGGTGVVSVPLAPGSGAGIGAAAIRGGPSGTLLIAGTDLTTKLTPRGAVLRLLPNGAVDTRFGIGGVARVSRRGRPLRLTSMVRDSEGRILVAGVGKAPGALVVRLRGNGLHDTHFGNGGLTYPEFGRPPGGRPIFTTIAAIDVFHSEALLVGAAAGPGTLVRAGSGTTSYTGRFALTVSRLH